MQRQWRNKCLLAGSSWLAQSIPHRTQELKMAPPRMGWALPHKATIKKCPTGLPIARSYGSIFSTETSPYLVTLTVSSWHKTSQYSEDPDSKNKVESNRTVPDYSFRLRHSTQQNTFMS